ncbi:MAG: hypothetical protein ABIH72_00895 [archaeon]
MNIEYCMDKPLKEFPSREKYAVPVSKVVDRICELQSIINDLQEKGIKYILANKDEGFSVWREKSAEDKGLTVQVNKIPHKNNWICWFDGQKAYIP